MQTSPKWGTRSPDLNGDSPDVPLWMRRMALDLDDHAKYLSGTLLARPSAALSGRFYRVEGDSDATQNGRLYLSNGASWDEISERSNVGKQLFFHLESSTHLPVGGQPPASASMLLPAGITRSMVTQVSISLEGNAGNYDECICGWSWVDSTHIRHWVRNLGAYPNSSNVNVHMTCFLA